MTGQLSGMILAEVDFYIKGLLKYELFGHELWITTTHVCVLIVFLILGIFALCANRAMKHASDVPTGFQIQVALTDEVKEPDKDAMEKMERRLL